MCPRTGSDEGLIMDFTAWENMAFGYHHDPAYNSGLLMNNAAIKADCAEKMERYDVRPPNPRCSRAQLLGRQPAEDRAGPRDRTRARYPAAGRPAHARRRHRRDRVHSQADPRAARPGQGDPAGQVELDEIMSLSDRIAVMFDGRIMGERLPSETNENELGLLMAGVDRGGRVDGQDAALGRRHPDPADLAASGADRVGVVILMDRREPGRGDAS
jgi:hypothetical protein